MKQPVRISNFFRFLTVLTLYMSTGLTGISFGQEIDAEIPELEVKSKLTQVKVDGYGLFYVRGTASYSSEERAAAIGRRIVKAASNGSIPVDSVKIVPVDDHVRIFAGKEFIMVITREDAAVERIDLDLLSKWVQQKVKSAISSYRLERSGPMLFKKSMYALGATILFAATILVLLWLLKRMKRGLHNRIRSRIDSMENKSFRLIRSTQLWRAINIFLRTLKILTILVLTATFLQYVLGLFPYTKDVADYTLGILLDPIISIGTGFVNFLPSLAFLIIIYFLTRYLLKLIKLFFTGIQEGGIKVQRFEDEWAMPTYRILRIVVIVFALVIAYPYIPGSETSAFKGISVFLGVLLSLGSSSFISNIIAGYSMTYRGAFKIGDLIQVDDFTGFVEEQRVLVTRLRSRKNEDISIPNSVMLSSNIINYSKRARDLGLILHTTVGIGYETPWRLVDSMLKLAAERTEGLLKQPPPFVLKQSLGDFAITYEINVYCEDPSQMMNYYNLLHENILDVFNENNIQIMTPAYESDPEIPKVVPGDQQYRTVL